ncbi:WecB/TagA/CpsF family glycosyltransferase [Cyanobacterium sp. uoEpiScrs1]|uniref:WecB/TagA/CpsF family glycosyltransferase n=1 Tax=Cyanobacterium sp. uoEpiScrs1 TaxID=2976343 RepID=UPI00226A46FB|nr:WecB/TagA/CpsF family glycosyltransferase [Cyanobacterium sp. uoEpiScrs1]
MLTPPPSFPILNVFVHLLDDYSSWLLQCLNHHQGVHVVTLNAEMAMLAEKDSSVTDIIRKADLVVPDGAGVILYLRLRQQRQQRCPGIELAESLLRELGSRENSPLIVFYGGKPGVSHAAADQWCKKLPSISILSSHGYLSSEEEKLWRQTLLDKQPQLILVGLGVPRQEFWIQQHRHLSPRGIWIGVGGSFDIWSGTKARAPQWLRDNNLEWLYRLYQEPWRWQRMLALPRFFLRSLIH